MQRIGSSGGVDPTRYSDLNTEGDGPEQVLDGPPPPGPKTEGDTFDQPDELVPLPKLHVEPPKQGTIYGSDLSNVIGGTPPPPTSGTTHGAQPVKQAPYNDWPVHIRIPRPPPPVSTGTRSMTAADTVGALTGSKGQADAMPSPGQIAQSARDLGLRASVTHGSSLRDITHMINHGAPPIALVDTGNGPAYVTISGYGTDSKGRVNSITTTDVDGKQTKMSVAEFEKAWSGVEINGHTSDRTLISTLPKGNRPMRSVDGTIYTASSVALPKQDPATAPPAAAPAGPDAGKVIEDFFKGIGDFFSTLFKGPIQG